MLNYTFQEESVTSDTKSVGRKYDRFESSTPFDVPNGSPYNWFVVRINVNVYGGI